MTKTVLLNFQEHAKVKVITKKSAALGDAQMAGFTFVSEFRQVQAHYPIFFQKDTQSGQFFPVALFGLTPNSNLFLTDSGWDAAYIPLSIERQPFSIGHQQGKRVIHIDIESAKISQHEGHPLFSELGEYTPFLERMGQSLELLHQGIGENKPFIDLLLEYGLIESVSFDIELKSGQSHQLNGFYTINEKALSLLSADKLAMLQQKGYLAAIYMMLASQSQMVALINKQNALF
ncbi:Peptide transport system permease protein SapC [Pseudoalteromonas luteoviolacea B = ATCC 29581]|nr:Peptide transport system permease protein SapC [Pseudoalteromonas luteoviolacea B = ATCC 29581]